MKVWNSFGNSCKPQVQQVEDALRHAQEVQQERDLADQGLLERQPEVVPVLMRTHNAMRILSAIFNLTAHEDVRDIVLELWLPLQPSSPLPACQARGLPMAGGRLRDGRARFPDCACCSISQGPSHDAVVIARGSSLYRQVASVLEGPLAAFTVAAKTSVHM